MSGSVSAPCLHAASVANAPWQPLVKVEFRIQVIKQNRSTEEFLKFKVRKHDTLDRNNKKRLVSTLG